MNTEKLEKQLKVIATQADKTQFIYDLLLAYQQPKASVTRLQKGDYNLAKTAGDILWKQKLFFRASDQDDLHEQIDQLQNDRAITDKHPRFIVLTDFQMLLAVDTKTADTLDIALTDLHKHYDFFLPWAGMEKTQYQ
ncbi:MAG: type IIL restriction-modification enzyme MmeI, partial [Endozoicomonas sp.]